MIEACPLKIDINNGYDMMAIEQIAATHTNVNKMLVSFENV